MLLMNHLVCRDIWKNITGETA